MYNIYSCDMISEITEKIYSLASRIPDDSPLQLPSA